MSLSASAVLAELLQSRSKRKAAFTTLSKRTFSYSSSGSRVAYFVRSISDILPRGSWQFAPVFYIGNLLYSSGKVLPCGRRAFMVTADQQFLGIREWVLTVRGIRGQESLGTWYVLQEILAFNDHSLINDLTNQGLLTSSSMRCYFRYVPCEKLSWISRRSVVLPGSLLIYVYIIIFA